MTKIPLWYMIKLIKMNNSAQQHTKNLDIFDKMRSGEPIRLDDTQYSKIQAVVDRTLKLNVLLNTSGSIELIRKNLSEIIGSEIDVSTIIFIPFYTNFGRFIDIGKNVFINHACTFLDMGGITLEDNVLYWSESKPNYRESSLKS